MNADEKLVFSANDEPEQCDLDLFASMRGQYTSAAEQEFFVQMERKEMGECAFSNELLIDSDENSDGIFIVRSFYDEYKISRLPFDGMERGAYVDSLSDLLAVDMRVVGLCDRDITVWQWLRERDYAGIRYDRNFMLQ